MELQGKIIEKLPLQSGISKNGSEWALQPYVLETLDNYPKKIYFEVFGLQKVQEQDADVDDIVQISFDIDSREYNGRWFTSLRAWRVVKDAASAEPLEEAEPEEEPKDKLPF